MNNPGFDRFQPLALIGTNQQAAKILQPICNSTNATLWLPESVGKLVNNCQCYQTSLAEHLNGIWQNYRAFIFCLATGAVIRLLSPLLQDKATDPAVVVIDAEGKFVISLCSGHQGGADLLAQLIATQIDATPVITGASHNHNLPAIDTLGLPYGWVKGQGDWTGIMAAAARQETIQVIQEVGSTLWQDHLPTSHSFFFGHPELNQPSPQGRIWISATQRKFAPKSDFPKVQWHPRVLWIGIGCERGTRQELISQAISTTCANYHLASEAIAGIATITLKADEIGLLEFCHQHNLPLKTFSARELDRVSVPTPSARVKQEVGTASVAEAAAILAADNSLLVTKQIFKQEHKGAVTVAIAQSKIESTGRTGKLYLVGIGPGNLEQITPAAKTAIIEADAVIGYSLYTDLIKPLNRVGQIIESLPITQEKQRAQRAISLANWGLTVAMISSGDCGIYGMAGLVLEELPATGWDGKTPSIKVFPGISALQAAASRVGAPLMHDFCAISLSDLLTPWSIIEKRLTAAAAADFITTIYNPRSQTRTTQIITAQKIFAQHRPANTPVAIVHNAYRDQEQVIVTTLDKMLDTEIDMLTTVIIGNNSTRNYANWMITPRGYSVKKS